MQEAASFGIRSARWVVRPTISIRKLKRFTHGAIVYGKVGSVRKECSLVPTESISDQASGRQDNIGLGSPSATGYSLLEALMVR